MAAKIFGGKLGVKVSVWRTPDNTLMLKVGSGRRARKVQLAPLVARRLAMFLLEGSVRAEIQKTRMQFLV